MKRYIRLAALTALILVFGAAGLAKLVAATSFEGQFVHFGLARWWVYVTGAVELAGAALLSRRASRRFGAILLAATMAAATALHLRYDPIALALPACALMLISGYLALSERNQGATPVPARA